MCLSFFHSNNIFVAFIACPSCEHINRLKLTWDVCDILLLFDTVNPRCMWGWEYFRSNNVMVLIHWFC